MHKLNVFHWHLVDDHGWRFESKKFPLLAQIGAWREQPPIGRYGGFSTQQEMREVVAYAAKLHITVLPEIEMTGALHPSLGSKFQQASYKMRIGGGWEPDRMEASLA